MQSKLKVRKEKEAEDKKKNEVKVEDISIYEEPIQNSEETPPEIDLYAESLTPEQLKLIDSLAESSNSNRFKSFLLGKLEELKHANLLKDALPEFIKYNKLKAKEITNQCLKNQISINHQKQWIEKLRNENKGQQDIRHEEDKLNEFVNNITEEIIKALKFIDDFENCCLVLSNELKQLTEEETRKAKEEIKQAFEEYEATSKEVLQERRRYITKHIRETIDSNTEPYDIIIPLSSLASLNEGCEIICNAEPDETKTYTIISMQGNANKGKTYILSKICQVNLPSGDALSTVGINFKYLKKQQNNANNENNENNENNNLLLIDSMGFDNVLKLTGNGIKGQTKNGENDLIENLIIDRTHKEIFIQNFMIDVSHVCIVVMDSLTSTDQILKKHISRYNKKVIIIHNLSRFEKIKDVKKYIDNTLKKTFILEESVIELNKGAMEKSGSKTSNLCYYLEKVPSSITKDTFQIDHFVIAKEGTEAGDHYNNATFYYIRVLLKSCVNRRVFNPVKEIVDSLNKNINNIYDKIEKGEVVEYVEKNNKKFIELKCNESKGLKKIIVDSFGTVCSISKINNYYIYLDPQFRKNPEDQRLVFDLDIADVNYSTVKAERVKQDDCFIITIKGEKKNLMSSTQEGVEKKIEIFNNKEETLKFSFEYKAPLILSKCEKDFRIIDKCEIIYNDEYETYGLIQVAFNLQEI
jgi:hypothetical protein